VSKLVDRLKASGVWVDKRNMELGDALPEKIEAGIGGASTYILVLSRSSSQSPWVRYESNMATIRHLEDANFRVLVLKIDDCQVPLRFRQYLFADLTKDSKAIEHLVEAARSQSGSTELYRRHFVDRSHEIGQIEASVNDPDKSIICLHGFYGIGKRTLAEECISRLWQSPRTSVITLSAAHTGARLAAELCAAAGLPIPPDGTSVDGIRRTLLMAAETLVSNNRIVMFDQLDHLLDEDGHPHGEIAEVIDHISVLSPSFNVPCFILSRRFPKFSLMTSLRVGFVKVGPIAVGYLVAILENEAKRMSRKAIQRGPEWKTLAEQLFGYPLAGRLAAPLLVKYPPEYLLQNLFHITALRRDIAEAILASIQFSAEQVRILQTLALCDSPLSVLDLASVTTRDPEEVATDIDVLADHNVIEAEGTAVKLHPLVSDFYWKQVRSGPDFKTLAMKTADYAREKLAELKVDSPRFVTWLASACRLLFLTDRKEEAYKLRRDFVGELKIAAIELYQRGEYETSLQYCQEYLLHYPEDFEINVHRARNLSRLSRPDESLKVVEELFKKATTPVRVAKLYFVQARTYLEMRQLDAARSSFLKALEFKPKSLPALQGITEVLLKQGYVEDAAGFVERALDVAPRDSFALSMKAEVLWKQGRHQDAIATMSLVVKAQPENATFLFRLGRFLQQSGVFEDAYDYFKRAKASDMSYLDARMSLASTAIDLGKLDEAKAEIDSLRNKGPIDKRYVLDGIEAQYYLAIGDTEKAAEHAAKALEHRRTVITLGTMARVEAARARSAADQGMVVMAGSYRDRTLHLIEEGLLLEPGNGPLTHQRERILEESVLWR